MAKQTVFYMNGIKVEVDTENGDMYFNGSKAEIETIGNNWYKAKSRIIRTKNPKKVIGARKRKKALHASYKQYNVSLNFNKG